MTSTSLDILNEKNVSVLRPDNTWEPMSFKDLKVGDKFKALGTLCTKDFPVSINPRLELDGEDFVYTAIPKLID